MAYTMDDWKMILATSALLICMIWDIALDILKDYTKVPSWMPSKLFVLNSLTILIIGNVDIEKGNGLSPSDEKYMEVLVHNQLRTDAARLTLCVFVGCIMPGIAMAGTQGGWSNVAALFLTFSFHIATEIYALQNGNNDSTVEREWGPWFVSSGVLLSLAASSLLLLLGGVMLFGKMGRRAVHYDIPKVLSEDDKNEGNRWESLRTKVMKSWVAVRAWKTNHLVRDSSFSPAGGIIVTICVVVMVAKVTYRSSLLHHNNGGANLIFCLECIFILVGWILILWRWFKVAFYCANSVGKEDFFTAVLAPLSSAIIVGHVLCPTLVVRLLCSLKNGDFSFLIFISCLAPILLLFVLILAVSLLCLFCFICWYLSFLVFSSQFVQHLFKLDNEGVSRNEEYSKYQSVLHGMGLNENGIQIFWKVNKKSFDRIKDRKNEVSQIAPKKRSGLLSIMESASVAKNQCFRLHDDKTHSWMGAISRIFSAIAEIKISLDIKEALAAYKEVQDVLKFVDCPDNVVVDPLNIFGNLNWEGFWDSLGCEVEMYEAEKGLGGAVQINQERVEELVSRLNSLGREMFNSSLITIDERCYDNVEAFSEKLRMMVGHVIVSCMLEAPDLLVKYSRRWAENFDEGRIERAIELAQKVSGLLENLVKDRDSHSEEMGQVASQSQERTSEADIGPAP